MTQKQVTCIPYVSIYARESIFKPSDQNWSDTFWISKEEGLFYLCRENKSADQSKIVQSLLFVNPKFHVSSLLQCLFRLACDRTGRKH